MAMAPSAGPQPPETVQVTLPPLTDVTAGSLAASQHHELARLADLDLSGADLRRTTFSESALQRLVLDATDLRGVHLAECRLDQLDAARCSVPRSSWRDVVLAGSRLGAVEAYESTWRAVLVTDSKLGYLNARGSTWTDVTFRGCTVDELDLTDARLTRVRLDDCRVRSLRLGGTILTDVDLRTARLAELEGLAGLAGAWVSEQQLTELAPLLAAHLGIRIG
jgi:uncharacterized protein YjbI with pentapeptide repeats